jgi:hypothetical protein
MSPIMDIETRPVFSKRLTHAGHVCQFVIGRTGTGVWEVREECDSRVVRQVRYTDWHRVERARSVFALRASLLEDEGWTAS